MIVIGVTGKSGAGKTTFADFLGERRNVGVIHLDDTINGVKEDKFKLDDTRAFKNAHGPEIVVTLKSFFKTSSTSIEPGSDIRGYPASLTSATSPSSFKTVIILSQVNVSLNLW